MNIFFREMKAHRKSLLIWCAGIFFMVYAGMAKYAALSPSGQSINDIMSKMPKSIQAISGVGTFDLSKASGFYGLLYLYLAVMAAIHASMLGADIISKEERDKTTEFLFAKPVSRSGIITSKLLAGLVNVIIFNIVTLLFSISAVRYFGKGENVNEDIMVLMGGMFMLQLIFLSMGAGIAALSKKPGTSSSLSTGILLLSFIFNVAVDLNDKLDVLKYFTPFKYYDARDLMYGRGSEPVYVILSLIIIGVFSTAAYVFYKRRDLSI